MKMKQLLVIDSPDSEHTLYGLGEDGVVYVFRNEVKPSKVESARLDLSGRVAYQGQGQHQHSVQQYDGHQHNMGQSYPFQGTPPQEVLAHQQRLACGGLVPEKETVWYPGFTAGWFPLPMGESKVTCLPDDPKKCELT